MLAVPARADVGLRADPARAPLELTLDDDGGRLLTVVADPATGEVRLTVPDRPASRVPLRLEDDGALTLRMLLDAAVVEVFPGGGAVAAARLPPDGELRLGLSGAGDGARLQEWSCTACHGSSADAAIVGAAAHGARRSLFPVPSRGAPLPEQPEPIDGSADGPVGGAVAAPARRRRTRLLLTLAVVVLLADLVTKLIVVATIAPGERHPGARRAGLPDPAAQRRRRVLLRRGRDGRCSA